MVLRLTAAALILTTIGCASAAPPRPAPARIGQSALYRCADGREVEIVYGGDAAVITIQGQPVQMTTAAAASGARYTGDGWQWWSKGMRTGVLARLAPGEDVASAAGVGCSVR